MKKFLSVKDVPDVGALVRSVLEIKMERRFQAHSSFGQQKKTLALLFFNPSLRTRLSTEKAARNLGLDVITLNTGEGWQLEFEDGAIMNLDKAEHVKDAARVISQYADMIGIRTFPSLVDRHRDYAEHVLQQFVRYAGVPVLNLESATVHPLQSLADIVTITEHQTVRKPKVVISWAPHPRALPQSVANSFLEWMRTQEVDLVLTHPRGAELDPQFTANVTLEYDQWKAFEGADFIYAKNWSSWSDYGNIIMPDRDWMITSAKMAVTRSARFMHCLPVRRNVVVEDDVIDGDRSLVIQQAANREFATQAVLESLLSEGQES